MMVRPLLPNQSGNQPGWPMSQTPGLLLAGALPRSTKNVEPDSGLPFRLTPHDLRLAWRASKIDLLMLSFGYRYDRVSPFLYPALASIDLHLAGSPWPLLLGYRL